MSSTSIWGDSRSLASTFLSLVRPQSSPNSDGLASSYAPSSRKRRDHEHYQPAQDTENVAMTTNSQDLPALRDDYEEGEVEADFGALEVFNSNTISSSLAIKPVSSKKERRGKKGQRDKKNNSSTKSQKSKHKLSSSINSHHNTNTPTVTPTSPSKKKRKNSDLSDGTSQKKRKSHAAINSISKEPANPEPLNSPSAVLLHTRGLSGNVEAIALEAWQEHINTQASQQQDAEMAKLAADSIEITAEVPVEPTSEVPAVEALSEDPADAPAGEVASTSRRLRSTRKKSKPTFFDEPVTDASLDIFGQLPSPSAITPNPRRAKRAAPKKGPIRQRKAEREELQAESSGLNPKSPRLNHKGGKFSEEELSRVAHAIESFRAEYNMEQRDVNEMIQAHGGTSAGKAHAELWMRIFAECPNRHRQKVINVARKKFHNFVARGTWTVDQDNELSGLINEHGTAWAKIAGMINRHPEDVRDRYRNYLICGGAQKKEAWDEEEEARLAHYIQEAMLKIDEARIENPEKKLLQTRTYEELIEWQNISECMGRTRSRLQCITKWKAMNSRIHSTGRLVSADPDSSISFRLDKARRQLEDMPDTEKYRLVLAIKSLSVSSTAKIPWQRLCDKQFRNSWHRATQELVWARLVKSVPGSESRTVRDCAQYLADKYDQDGLPNIAGEGWDDEEEIALINQ